MTTANTDAIKEAVNIEKKQRATPIPQGYDRTQAGALALPLKERADLRNALQASIDQEKAALKAAADEAAKL